MLSAGADAHSQSPAGVRSMRGFLVRGRHRGATELVRKSRNVGKTRVASLDRVRNDTIRQRFGVATIAAKLREARLRWYGHVLRANDDTVCKIGLNLEVPGRRPRGRPKQRWLDTLRLDLKIAGLFPKENIEFAESVTEDQSTLLKEVFNKHASFDEVGEMIEAVEAKSPELAKKMRAVLDKNCARLEGLSPEAIGYSKKVIHYVTQIMCNLSLGKEFCCKQAEHLHDDFKNLPASDQAALKKMNPDIDF
ncbi:unnamed protein product [Heligmosomoides polygyrus]|uniref:Uncharacterized protein n=1 Tax=Heligmosomoides polygyrus TaxID=6339 RepID=A0A183FRK5_HELPZ|nr:unnamed protein product [Heligmosomoides polygyrus]